MFKKKYLFKKYSVVDSYYIYEPTYGQIYKFEKLIYDNISSLLNKKENHDEHNFVDNELIEEFESNYSKLFYKFDTNEDFNKKKASTLKSISKLNSNIETLALSLTESCNLKCKYCIYDDKYMQSRNSSSQKMKFSDVKKVLKKVIEQKNNSTIDLNFYGGEPLLEFDLIVRIVDYCILHKIKATYSITTNGTLLSEDIIKFLIKNNFMVSISLDINEEIHDKNRVYADNSGSYTIIERGINNIKTIDSKYFEKNVSFLATIDKNEDMQKVNEVLKNNSKFIVSPIEKNESEEVEEFKKSIKERHNQEVNNYQPFLDKFGSILKNDQTLTYQMSSTLNSLNAIHNRQSNVHKIHLGGSCFPLGSKLFLDTKGDLFICEKIDYDLQLGQAHEWLDKKKMLEYTQLYVDFKIENCYYCWAKNLCSLCFHSFAKEGRFVINKLDCFHEKKVIENNLKLYSLLCRQYTQKEIEKVFKG